MATRKLNAHPLNHLLRSALTRTAAGALGATAPLMALANPTGGQVVGGSATINAPSGNGLVINQNSQRAVIDWQQFNVGANEYVQFVQPNSSSVVLNKVIGGSPSSIFGDIKANGQVFLVNPNGVYFAPGSSIDVQGLVASTLDMDSAAFMRGKNVFTKGSGAPDATVVNQGSIVTARGGYVVLAGDYVQNDGSINAQAGRVVLAAGNNATLTLDKSQLVSYVVDGTTLARLAGVQNTGSITANGGGVIMTADVANTLTATAVNNSGLIMAQSARNENGAIVLLAKGGDIENSGTLDASAAANATGVAGGTIVIRGNEHTQLTSASRIDTSGNQAHGGFIELSGHTLGVRGGVKAGKGGTMLIDPAKINIVAGSGKNSQSVGTGSIGTGFIASKLDAGSNVAIVASNSIANTTGSHIVATGAGNLVIAIGTVGGATCGFGGICVGAGTGGASAINHLQGTVNLTGLPINIAGNLTIDAAGNASTGGQILTDNLKAKSIALTGNQVTVTGNITAIGGDVDIFAHSGSPSVTVTGTVNATGAFNASFSNEGGVPVGNMTLHDVTAGSINVSVANITAGNLHATGPAANGNINLVASHNSSAFSDGILNVNGTITVDHGNLSISAKGGGDSGAIISVTGGIVVAGNVDIQTQYIGSSTGGGQVHLGDVSGKNVSISAISSHPSIEVGNVTATGVGVSNGINIHASGAGSGSGVISAGNLTAHGRGLGGGVNVSMFLSGRTGDIKLGAVSAPRITVDLFANGDISTGPLTAVSAAGPAVIQVNAFAQSGSNAVKINGGITASGRPAAGSFSSAMPGGLPVAAKVVIGADGSNSHSRHDVKVSGNVSVTGAAHAYSFSSPNETGVIRHFTGSGVGGVAEFNINAGGSSGSANVGGDITVIGPDAIVSARGDQIVLHNITVTGQGHTANRKDTGSVLSNVLFSSHNSVGLAIVDIGGKNSGSYGGPTGVLKVGDVSVSGKGVARVGLFGSHVTAGNVTATAIAAKGTVTTQSGLTSSGFGNPLGSIDFLRGLGDTGLDNGNLTVGLADVVMGLSPNSFSHAAGQAAGITVGSVTVTGVGEAQIGLFGNKVQTRALSATATKGIEVGNGSDQSGSGRSFKQTVNINGGSAGVEIKSGSSGGAGPVTVAGGINVKGPVAGVNINGSTIKVSGSISVTGTGASVTSDVQFTSASSNYHTHFVGPGNTTGVNIGGVTSTASVNVGGTVKVKGPGLVGIAIGGNNVTLGGVSASASAARAYSVLDTRVSTTTDNFTAGSLAILIVEGDSSGITGPATITGDVLLNAPHGNVFMPGQLTVGGTVTVTAAGGIGTDPSTIAPRFNEVGGVTGRNGGSDGIPSSGLGPLTLKAAGISLVAGGNLDLTSATLAATGKMQVQADGNLNLTGATLIAGGLNAIAGGSADLTSAAIVSTKGVTVTAGTHILLGLTDITAASSAVLSAGSSVSNGGSAGSIVAKGLKLTAGGNIVLTAETLHVNGAAALFSAFSDISMTGANITAGSFGADAGGNLDLSGVTMTVAGTTQLVAGLVFAGAKPLPMGGDLILSGIKLSTGVLEASVEGTIHNGGGPGTINAGALSLLASKDIDLSSTDITVGTGTVPGVIGDQTLIAGLQVAGIGPLSLAPNATFIAGGDLTLGGLSMTGSYLYLQAASVGILGKVTVPTGTVVQVAPIDPTASMGMEKTGSNGSGFNIANDSFVSLFPEITLVLGTSAETGDANLGKNGAFDIGDDNLVIATTGTVTGLEKVTSTGLVTSLLSLLGPPVPPPTSSEIDPNSGNNTGNKKHGETVGGEVTGTGTDTLIEHDNQPPSGTCH